MSDDVIGSIHNWFKLCHGDNKDIKLTVQTGVHFEEVAEMLDALKGDNVTVNDQIVSATLGLKNLAKTLKEGNTGIKLKTTTDVELLDALCDQIVTAIGVAYDKGFDIQAALAEVNRSNYSKFLDGVPVFDPNGKVIKSEYYTPPQIYAYV